MRILFLHGWQSVRIENVSREEMQRRFNEMMAGGKSE